VSTNFGLDTNFDLVAPIKARACDALQAVLKSRPRVLTSSRGSCVGRRALLT